MPCGNCEPKKNEVQQKPPDIPMLTFRNYMTCRSKCVPMDIRSSNSLHTKETPFCICAGRAQMYGCMHLHADACRCVQTCPVFIYLVDPVPLHMFRRCLTRMIHESFCRNRRSAALVHNASCSGTGVTGFWLLFQVSHSALAFQQTETNAVQLSAYAARPARDLSLVSLRFLRLRPSIIDNIEALVTLTLPFKIH